LHGLNFECVFNDNDIQADPLALLPENQLTLSTAIEFYHSVFFPRGDASDEVFAPFLFWTPLLNLILSSAVCLRLAPMPLQIFNLSTFLCTTTIFCFPTTEKLGSCDCY